MKLNEIEEYRKKDGGIRTLSLRAEEADENKMKISGVAVTANFIDSHNTMFTENCLKKNSGKNIIFTSDHMRDFQHLISNEAKTALKSMPKKEVGLNSDGEIPCLLFGAEIEADDNEQMFRAYKKGRVKQHSIEFLSSYKDEILCVKEDGNYKANWDKYYPLLANPEVADKRGWFSVYEKADIVGVSAVLLGSNKLTPTLSIRCDEGVFEKPEEKKSFFERIK